MRPHKLAAALAALALGAASAVPATAQGTMGQAPSGGMAMDAPATAPVDNVLGTGALPGVGTGTSTVPDMSGISGPGGMQNGVGAQGNMAPSMSGSAVTNDGTLPGTSSGSGFGIPLDAPADGN